MRPANTLVSLLAILHSSSVKAFCESLSIYQAYSKDCDQTVQMQTESSLGTHVNKVGFLFTLLLRLV